MATNPPKKLSLFQTCGVSIAGMVGGGIFAVLGEAVITAGDATFISLGLAGLLALITGLTYSKLTVAFDESGGAFRFIEHIFGAQAAGITSWFLIAGYICTVALYAFAFGSYGDRLLGLGIGPNPWLASAVIVGVMGLLLGQTYDPDEEYTSYFIALKIIILGGLVCIGFLTVHPSNIAIGADYLDHNIWVAAALIFVIYEGFQVLAYRYNLIQNHKQTLPKAIWISIGVVTILYMVIAFVQTSSLGPKVIAQYEETAIAMLAKPIAGQTGVSIVLVGGLISTAAAIYTTTTSTAYLAERVVSDHQLPSKLTALIWKKTPVLFTFLFGGAAILLQFISNLDDLVVLCSALFLMVFSMVNFAGYWHRVYRGWKRYLPLAACITCTGGFALLIYHEAHTSGYHTLFLLIGVMVILLVLRWIFSLFQRHGHFFQSTRK